MKVITILHLFITAIMLYILGQFTTVELLIIICYVFMSLDIVSAIVSKYMKGEFKSVTSEKFMIGVVRKIVIIHLFLLLAFTLKQIFGIQTYIFFTAIYGLYEIKSIDENIASITGTSLLDDILKKLIFFKDAKDKIEGNNKNTNV
ncbi:MAG: phage holin family protein [Candidatus Aenigmatarchaeota archaeon]